MAGKQPTRQDQILARMSRGFQQNDSKFVGQIFGKPGSGKTFMLAGLAQTLKGDGEILWLDSSDGFISLKDEDWAQEDLLYSGFTPASDLTAAAVALREAKRTGAGDLAGVTVVVLDEFSSWYQEILEDAARGRTGTNADDNMPEVIGNDHSLPAGVLVAAFEKFHAIPGVHVLLGAHVREKVARNGGSTIFHPHYPPLMRINIEAKLHSSVLLRSKLTGKGAKERTVVTDLTSTVEAKNRISGMSGEITPREYIQRVAAWVEKTDYTGPHEDLSDLPDDPADQADEA